MSVSAMRSSMSTWGPPSLFLGSVWVNSPLLPGWPGVRGETGSQAFFLNTCVCVAAAHSVLFDSTSLIRHPVPWQPQGLNSSVKSLSTQTHAHSPQRRERGRVSERGSRGAEEETIAGLLSTAPSGFHYKVYERLHPGLVCLIYSGRG